MKTKRSDTPSRRPCGHQYPGLGWPTGASYFGPGIEMHARENTAGIICQKKKGHSGKHQHNRCRPDPLFQGLSWNEEFSW